MEPANQIRALRDKAGVTQLEVSAASGIPRPVVSLLESGRVGADQATITSIRRAIVEAARTKAENLMSFVEENSAECRAS